MLIFRRRLLSNCSRHPNLIDDRPACYCFHSLDKCIINLKLPQIIGVIVVIYVRERTLIGIKSKFDMIMIDHFSRFAYTRILFVYLFAQSIN